MKKHLNIDSVATELRDASLFFRKPVEAPSAPPAPSPAVARIAARDDKRPSRTGSTPRPPRTPDRPTRRVTRRHAFDIYDDQLASLRRLSMADRLNGGAGSMSQMVRDALDRFLGEEAKQREP
jgi:hypothetical protein